MNWLLCFPIGLIVLSVRFCVYAAVSQRGPMIDKLLYDGCYSSINQAFLLHALRIYMYILHMSVYLDV